MSPSHDFTEEYTRKQTILYHNASHIVMTSNQQYQEKTLIFY